MVRIEFNEKVWVTMSKSDDTPTSKARPAFTTSMHDSSSKSASKRGHGGVGMAPCRVVVTKYDVSILSEKRERPTTLACLPFAGSALGSATMLHRHSPGMSITRYGSTDVALNPTADNVQLHFGEPAEATEFYRTVAERITLNEAASPLSRDALPSANRRLHNDPMYGESGSFAMSPSRIDSPASMKSPAGAGFISTFSPSVHPPAAAANRRLELYKQAREAVTDQLAADQKFEAAIARHSQQEESSLAALARMVVDRDRRHDAILSRQAMVEKDTTIHNKYEQLASETKLRRDQVKEQYYQYEMERVDQQRKEEEAMNMDARRLFFGGNAGDNEENEMLEAQLEKERRERWAEHTKAAGQFGDATWELLRGELHQLESNELATMTGDMNRDIFGTSRTGSITQPAAHHYPPAQSLMSGADETVVERATILQDIQGAIRNFDAEASPLRRGPSASTNTIAPESHETELEMKRCKSVEARAATERGSLMTNIRDLLSQHQKDADEFTKHAREQEAAEAALAAKIRREVEEEQAAAQRRAREAAKKATESADLVAAREAEQKLLASLVTHRSLDNVPLGPPTPVAASHPASVPRTPPPAENKEAPTPDRPSPFPGTPTVAQLSASFQGSATPTSQPTTPVAKNEVTKAEKVALFEAKAEGDWVEKKDAKTGKLYYMNKVTKKTSWKKPENFSAPASPAVPSSVGSPLADEWIEKTDPKTGKVYYQHKTTKKTTWKKPEGSVAPMSPTPSTVSSPVSSDWVEKTDAKTGKLYYMNKVTKKTSWKKPENFSAPASPAVPSTPSTPQAGEWIEKTDPKTGKVYYQHKTTKKTTWKKPEEVSAPASPVPSSVGSPVSSDWVEKTDAKTGKLYYMNKVTKKTSWKKPEDFSAPASPAVPSAEEWVEKTDPKTGKLYYMNKVTKKTSWKKPF